MQGKEAANGVQFPTSNTQGEINQTDTDMWSTMKIEVVLLKVHSTHTQKDFECDIALDGMFNCSIAMPSIFGVDN